jgi:N,N'-diacetyllegionaminate synthase
MPKPKPKYFIIEAANTHGGSFEYLLELVESFSKYGSGFGMKFQPLHPDKIATPNYTYYSIYQELFINESQWKKVINKTAQTKDVWLDIFDVYGVKIFRNNIDSIIGIKFQSSVLHNYEVFDSLAKCDLSAKKVILNVAAQSIEDIHAILHRVNHQLQPEEILLEFGYQAYPTSLDDSGFCKIKEIRSHFGNRLVFADHLSGDSDDSITLPLVVAMAGVEVIEKHVMLSNQVTKYDHYSSLIPERFAEMVKRIQHFVSLENKSFINQNEREYLRNTLMIPILKHDKEAGSLINLSEDLIFRRSGYSGLTVKEIIALQKGFHILSTGKKAGETLHHEDFKRAVIATIIACRLKSSRLPKKALLPIGKLSSVERCIKSCLEFSGVNHTILATSDNKEDSKLKDYTYRSDVVFHTGDPEDVIQRYLSIADKLKVDVIIRLTADMPFVAREIVEATLVEHFKKGADYTVPRKMAVGSGAEIINTMALKKVKRHFPNAKYSEYMTWYFQNNSSHFRLNFIDIDQNLVRDYRLTLDYAEDLKMFNILQEHFDENDSEFKILEAFSYLDEHSEVRNINQHLTLRYKVDQELIDILNRETKIPL